MCGRSLPCLALAACLLLLSDCNSDPAAAELTVPQRIGSGEGTGGRDREQHLYLQLPAFGTELTLYLRRERSFLSPAFTAEERGGGAEGVRPLPTQPLCFYTGHVLKHNRSSASLSTCNGLFGYIQIGDDLLSIEPVNKLNSSFSGEVHHIYKHRRSLLSEKKHLPRDFYNVIKGRRKRLKKTEGWRTRRNAIRFTNEYTVETLVVADSDMVEYHGAEAAQRFILTVMNMVYNMFQHHSLGIKINIQVTKLVLLHSRPEQLLISHHGERSLESFCHWQYKEFGVKYLGNNQVPGGKDDFPAVDAAVFVTSGGEIYQVFAPGLKWQKISSIKICAA